MKFRTFLLPFRLDLFGDRPARPRRLPRSLYLESLEDRTTPSILFQPGSPYHTIDYGGPVIQHVDVDLIFWGDAWANSRNLAGKLQTAVGSIVSGPYLTDLAQYRGIGPGTLERMDFISDNRLPARFSANDVVSVLRDAILNGVVPDPRTDPSRLYFLVPPPGSHFAIGGGLGEAGGYHNYTISPLDGVTPVVYGFEANPRGRLEFLTSLFSHEVVEAVTDPAGATTPAFQLAPGGGDKELCDNDAEKYSYRIDNFQYRVEPYWSDRADAYIVPTGDNQDFRVNNYVNRILYVTGDQLANLNDVITVDLTSRGGVKVTLNNTVAQFNRKEIKGIIVIPGQGTNTVTIAKSNVPIHVNFLLGTGDTINVGSPGNGRLDNIRAPLRAIGHAGDVDVVFNDQGNPRVGDTYTLDRRRLTRTGLLGAFHYKSVHSLTLNTGAQNKTVTIKATEPNTPTTVNLNGGNVTLNIGDPARRRRVINSLRGPLTVNSQGAAVDAIINDQDNARNGQVYTLTPTQLTRTGGIAFNHDMFQTLVLNTGSGTDTVLLQTNQAGTTIRGGGNTTVEVQVMVSTAQVMLLNIQVVQIDAGANLDVVNNLTVGMGVTVQGGILSGTGTVTGNVINNGQVNPGNNGGIGVLTIQGNYTQTAAGFLNILIGGYGAGVGYDQLSVTGAVNLSGTLNVGLINGFVPMLNDTFQILTFGAQNGDFQVKNGLQLGANRFDPRYQAESLILVVVSAGAPIHEFPNAGGAGPLLIVAGPDGNLWFAEDTAEIGRITPAGVVTEFLVPTGGSEPWNITAGPDGNLWFTELYGGQIGRITPAGVVTEFPIFGFEPWGITAGPDGNLWFTEPYTDQIGRITPAGGVTAFPVPTGGSDVGEITVGPDGNIWFTEEGADKIGRITPAGVITEFSGPTGGSTPDGITTGPDGNLWFTEYYGNQIGRITLAGVVTEFAIPTFGSGPVGITAGPDGNLWFTEYNADQIGEFVLGPTASDASGSAFSHAGHGDAARAMTVFPSRFVLPTKSSPPTLPRAVSPSLDGARVDRFFAAPHTESQGDAGFGWQYSRNSAVPATGEAPIGLEPVGPWNLPDLLLPMWEGIA